MIDVCLILEGTYPYVAGGVSTWVHQLITAMPDLRFGIVAISPQVDPTRRLKYPLPAHVVALHEIALHDYQLAPRRGRRPQPEDVALLGTFLDEARQGRFTRFADVAACFQGTGACLDLPTTCRDPQLWSLLTEVYRRAAPTISFLDFFWTCRATLLPVVQVLTAAIPPARIYHAISTGYAGLFGALAAVTTGDRLLITEHGIYTHERRLEISQADWIFAQEPETERAVRDLPFFKQWWIDFFRLLSGVAYAHADQVFTLYEGNRQREIRDGASPERITIIPNGIDPRPYAAVTRAPRDTPQIGLVGRVVPIKDVKTFLLAMAQVVITRPDAQGYILGPLDEEPGYAEECRRLCERLGLDGRVTFTGRVDPLEYYRFLDLVVLTSVSEAQPYVILEANCLGIPVVATDVGACRELLEGRTAEDRRLGPSGRLTEVGDPAATARAILTLLDDREQYAAMSQAGRERVRREYDHHDLLSRYLNWYERFL